MRRLLPATVLLASAILAGCQTPASLATTEGGQTRPQDVPTLLFPLLNQHPTPQVLLLGEQHDAVQHQQLELAVVTLLLRHGRLAALALEMAERGRSTAGLKPDAEEAQVQQALGWNEAGWPWAAYGPIVMAAVRDGVTVLGANLPRNQQRIAMRNEAFDSILTRPNLQKQQELIDAGHCGLLAKAQLRPMTRIQIARDQAMAQTLAQAVANMPLPNLDQRILGKPVVLLLSGNGHVHRELGVPQHLPATLSSRVVRLLSAEHTPSTSGTDSADTPADAAVDPDRAAFDATWPTAARPPKDYCAEFKATANPGSMQPQAQP